jgi:hypothetical protein
MRKRNKCGNLYLPLRRRYHHRYHLFLIHQLHTLCLA